MLLILEYFSKIFFLKCCVISRCETMKHFLFLHQASEITKACGAKWGLMNEEEKRPHIEKAIADRKRYEGEVGLSEDVKIVGG